MDERLNLGTYLKKTLKKDGMISIGSAVAFVIIGILIVMRPEAIMAAVSYILGGALIAFGIYNLISYFSEGGRKDFYNYDWVYGIILLVVGFVFLTQVTLLDAMFRIIVAVWLTYEALLRFTLSFRLKKYGLKNWWVVLVSSLLIMCLGIYILANQAILIKTLGILVIVYAVLDLINGIIFVYNINKIQD